jgi:hypothetical protein
MQRLHRLISAVLVSSLASSCIFSPGDCSYEHRSIEFSATLAPAPEAPAEPISAALMLNETRGSNPDFRTLHVEFTGTLTGTVATVELRDVETGLVLATFAGGSGFGAGWSANVDLGPTPTQETLRDLAEDGRLSLRLVRDPGTLPVLEGPLAVTSRTDWNHPRCD